MIRGTASLLFFSGLSLQLLNAHPAGAQTSESASEPVALHDGESLHYRIAWGIFPGAGEIKISAEKLPAQRPIDADSESAPLLRITTSTHTSGTLKKLFRFRAESLADFDLHTGLLQRSEERSKSKRKQTGQQLHFDYAARCADYRNEVQPEKSKTLALPPGQPMDLITSLMQTRAWELVPGQSRDALVIFDDDFYELTIHATGYETLTTPLGKFRTLVLEPRMERTEPKGMFKRGSTVKVWISQDAQRLPVRFQVEFKFGSGIATLIAYRPPNARVDHAPKRAPRRSRRGRARSSVIWSRRLP